MKLCRVFNHQNKANAYSDALEQAGYYFVDRPNVQGVSFYLSDADWREEMMEEARGRNVPVFLYPHAARPMVIYDGCVEPHPVRAMFTQAPGGKAIMEKIGYPYPVEVSGWAFSDVRPFRQTTEVKRVLFAPIHPNGNGWLSRMDQNLNRRTYDVLYDYCDTHKATLSVRYINSWSRSGLDGVRSGDFVEIHAGKKDNSTWDMASADVVISHQTFAWIAVALGIPTVMIGEDVPPRSGNSDTGFCYVKHWDDYKADLMYPLDILQGDPEKIIQDACEGTDAVEDWKSRLIGEPFDGPRFVEKLESYL